MARSEEAEPPTASAAARDRRERGIDTKVLLALIPVIAAVVAAVLSAIIAREPGDQSAPSLSTSLSSPTSTSPLPIPDCAGCKVGRTYPEQVGAGTPSTFRDPRYFAGAGPELRPPQQVAVLCKLRTPSAPSVGDYWYLVASAPWNGRFYAPSNGFLDGVDPDGKGTTVVDPRVPDC